MIPFAKVQACGNDFLIVESQNVTYFSPAELTQRLCERNTGVGADGVEYFQWISDLSARVRLHNADGSIAEISGNGTRCVAAYMAHKKNLGAGQLLTVDTDAGKRDCTVLHVDKHRYKIASSMGVPEVTGGEVVLADGRAVEGAIVSTGNPHFVIFVEDRAFNLFGRSWQDIGSEICHHSKFPSQTNVEFVHIVGPTEIDIRIFERGVGPTSSSGTGTCATAAATILLLDGERRLTVTAPGGAQQIVWPDNESEIVLTGPAEIVCFGEAF
jgi:diaminopimelate epimerase